MRLPRWARDATRPLTGRVPVPILSGVNRGRWWNLASAGSGYATGRRGVEQMRLLASLIEAGDCMWDVGAHHGYMTLSAARLVGATGLVHAFEPSAANHRILQRHLRWNRATNVSTLRVALSDFEGETTFGGTGTSKMLALGAGDERVRVARGDALVRDGRCTAPTVMKIDVEGAEAAVLRGAAATLERARPVVFLSTHGAEAHRESLDLLRGHGYVLSPILGRDLQTTSEVLALPAP